MRLMDADGHRSPQAPPMIRRIRAIESGTGRLLLAIGGYLLLTFFICIPIGIANSNLFWSESNQFGRVPIPGRQRVHLPARKVQINVAAVLPGRSTQTPELLVPDLQLTLIPPKGVTEPKIERSLGETQNSLDKYADTQRRIAYADVETAGTYLVVVEGDFTGYGVNGALWFGYEEAPIHGVTIWFIAMAIAALLLLGAFVVQQIRKRRRGPPSDDGELAATSYSTRKLREYEESPH
jgi:hypothetical protein